MPLEPASKEFKCKTCNAMLESQGLLDAHMFHHELENLQFACGKCDSKYKTQVLLNKHVQSSHSEREYNCYDCSFQGNTAFALKNHLKSSHHQSSINAEKEDNTLSCHSCELSFDSRYDLMSHRKSSHKEIIKKCKYFLRGACVYKDDCWYRHGDLTDGNLNLSEKRIFNCSFCESVFESLAQLMVHRKQVHDQASKFKCRDYKFGTCRFEATDCWYSHDDEPQTETQNKPNESGFQFVPQNSHPPDMMERIMTMMEKLSEKVNMLEKSAQIAQ